MIMELTQVYAVGVASLVALFCLLRAVFALARQIKRLLYTITLCYVYYPVLLRGRAGSTSLTRFHGIIITIYVVINIVCAAIGVSNLTQISTRLGTLALINVMPLMLGRTNAFVDILRLNLSTYGIIHRWVGRVALIQGLVHISISMRARSLHHREVFVSETDSFIELLLITVAAYNRLGASGIIATLRSSNLVRCILVLPSGLCVGTDSRVVAAHRLEALLALHLPSRRFLGLGGVSHHPIFATILQERRLWT